MGGEMKKLVVIATGWHFSLHFYRRMMEQRIPMDWYVEYICVSHRDPSYAIEEKSNIDGGSLLKDLDRILYRQVATQQQIEKLGWRYTLEPNTIGDWGCANQWLEKNHRPYDALLITHDDNFIVGNNIFEVALEGKVDGLYHNDYLSKSFRPKMWKSDWLVITNAFITGRPHLRGSFDFFSKEMMEMIGGKFDLSRVNLTREGQFDTPKDHKGVSEWNNHVVDFVGYLVHNDLFDRVYCLSNTYRVSNYCIEGERGFLSKSGLPLDITKIYEDGVQKLHNRRSLV